jgi:hypothetical protein
MNKIQIGMPKTVEMGEISMKMKKKEKRKICVNSKAPV